MTTVVVMGVSGSGKTTVGRLLATRLGATFVDADDHHSAAALAEMGEGRPLTDEQRGPWIDRVRAAVVEQAPRDVVLACSALTPAIRSRLTSDLRDVRWVWLRGTHDALAGRLARRRASPWNANPVGPSLLPSQLELLDPPAGAIAVDIARSPAEIVDAICETLAMT